MPLIWRKLYTSSKGVFKMKFSKLERFQIANNMIPEMSSEGIRHYYGSVAQRIEYLRNLGLGDNVIMEFNGLNYVVPVENSVNVFLEGGVFVNE